MAFSDFNPFKPNIALPEQPPADPTKYANGREPKLGDWCVHQHLYYSRQIVTLANRNFNSFLHEEDHNKPQRHND